jgi:hypothetical protein
MAGAQWASTTSPIMTGSVRYRFDKTMTGSSPDAFTGVSRCRRTTVVAVPRANISRMGYFALLAG